MGTVRSLHECWQVFVRNRVSRVHREAKAVPDPPSPSTGLSCDRAELNKEAAALMQYGAGLS